MDCHRSVLSSLFLQNLSQSASTTPPDPTPLNFSPQPSPNREPLRVLVIGSRQGVTSTIQTLYRLGFAPVNEWSPLLPAPSSGEVMSILTRYLPLL